MFTVKIIPNNIEVRVQGGCTLLTAQILAGIHPDAPCGGQGTCGKCLVNIIENGARTTVKACQYHVEKNVVIELAKENEFHILESGTKRKIDINPNLCDKAKKEKGVIGAAFDIGTTSVVCYLLDLATGKELAHASMLNPQSQFGADVISRCEYAIANGVDKLSNVIRDALNELIADACASANVDSQKIYIASIVGNTCMHHLYLGIDPKPLTVVPYEAVVKDEMVVSPAEVNMNINPNGKVQILPNIAGFVGADTIGCLLTTEFDELEDMSLLIDIGTNGEMVMGNKNHMIACSTAAGPAFEGAKIECGMRGKDGAIDHVKLENNIVVPHVLGSGKVEGICGSGLMDAVAVFLKARIIDETGKLFNPEKDDKETASEALKENIMRIGKTKEDLLKFTLKEIVYLSQKDIREVQLAKGAIAAGIELMAEKLGIKITDIKKVMIAGAFGNYMDPHSACTIGLIPKELEEKIEMIGNAAGEGSKIATLNKEEFSRAQKIRDKVEFLELASSPNFQDTFVDNLQFEE